MNCPSCRARLIKSLDVKFDPRTCDTEPFKVECPNCRFIFAVGYSIVQLKGPIAKLKK